jgi:tetratricopeptide (TPR) repeat protein
MSWLVHHIQSEQYSSQAQQFSKPHEEVVARKLYELAAKAEVNALNCLDSSKMRTFGITAVSAVSLYFKAQEFFLAKEFAEKWINIESMPSFAIEQLESLIQEIDTMKTELRSADPFKTNSNQEGIQDLSIKYYEIGLQELVKLLYKIDLQPTNLSEKWQQANIRSIVPLPSLTPTLRAKICLAIGIISVQEGYWLIGLDWLAACWEIYNNINDLRGLGEVSYQLAIGHHVANNFGYAGIYYRDALRLFQHLGDTLKVAFCHHGLGRLMLQMEKKEAAISEFSQALAIYRTVPDSFQSDFMSGDIYHYLVIIGKISGFTATNQVI